MLYSVHTRTVTFLEQLLREFSVGDHVLQICSENCFIFKHFQVKAAEEDASHILPVLLRSAVVLVKHHNQL